MGKFKVSYNLVKLAFSIINKEKELIVYSFISSICFIFVILSYFVFVLGLSFIGTFDATNSNTSSFINLILTFLFYFLLTFVGLFFNTAIITSVQRIITGQENSFKDGILSSFSNISKIFIWTLISAGVSTIIKLIQDRVPFASKIILSIVGAAWNIATFFAFPLIILGKKKTFVALKESPIMFKKGWGETTVANVGVGFFFGFLIILLLIISIILGFVGIFLHSIIMIVIVSIIFVLGVAILLLLSSTTDAVLKTLLYVYIKNESLPENIDLNILGQMFKEKEIKK